jgi:hypothetical protein
MTHDDLRRRVALLEATLREVLRIADAAETCGVCVPPSAAFDGDHARHWRDIVRKARRLLQQPG